MRPIEIAPVHEGKGRTFRALSLATVEADPLWSDTKTDDIRPVWAMFAGSEQDIRPFMANLVLGRKAQYVSEYSNSRSKETRMELLKSAGYQVTYQREAEGTIATAFLPDLFQLDPGMVDVDGVKFILLPSREWVSQQVLDVAPLVKHAARLNPLVNADTLAYLAPVSFLFATYLDRRTRCPLLADGRFYLQLLLACLTEGLASFSCERGGYYRERLFGVNPAFQFVEKDTGSVGLLPGIVFKSSHSAIEAVLAEQVSVFFKMTRGR